MPTIQVEAQLSSDELLKAVRQLSPPELDVFVSQAITLRAQRKAPSLPEAEADLLTAINRGLPPERQNRYADLIARRRVEALTPDEHAELLHLSDQMEELEA